MVAISLFLLTPDSDSRLIGIANPARWPMTMHANNEALWCSSMLLKSYSLFDLGLTFSKSVCDSIILSSWYLASVGWSSELFITNSYACNDIAVNFLFYLISNNLPWPTRTAAALTLLDIEATASIPSHHPYNPYTLSPWLPTPKETLQPPRTALMFPPRHMMAELSGGEWLRASRQKTKTAAACSQASRSIPVLLWSRDKDEWITFERWQWWPSHQRVRLAQDKDLIWASPKITIWRFIPREPSSSLEVTYAYACKLCHLHVSTKDDNLRFRFRLSRYRRAWTLREPYVISGWLPSKLDIKCTLKERFGQSITTHFICIPSSSPSRTHLLHWQQELSFFFYDVLQHRTLTSINRNRQSDEEDECQTRISSWTSYSTEYQMKSNKVMAGLLLKMGQAAVQVNKYNILHLLKSWTLT